MKSVGWWTALAAICCITLATVAAMVSGWAPPMGDPPLGWVLRALANWDAGWYAHIADQGYSYHPGEQSAVAYFPLYPLVVRATAVLTGDRFLAGVVVSAVAGFLGVLQFTRWVRQVLGEQAARSAWPFLVLYPFAFYLYGVMYSDGLFLLLVTSSFLALERGRIGWATALGALATACRPVAPALVLGLMARQWELRRRAGERPRWTDLLPVLASAGFLAFVAYQWMAFDEPLAFAKVQAAPGWDHVPGIRTWLKVTWFEQVTQTQSPWVFIRLMGHAVLTVAVLLSAIPMRRMLGWGYALYTAAVIGMPALTSKDLQGLGRYAIAAFPAFLILSLLLEKHPRWRIVYLIVSGALLIWLSIAFGANAYVA